MNTTLNSDEFYIHHPSKGKFFSISGLQFMSELIAEAVKTVGWDPTKVSFGIDNDIRVWVGYPSASTKLVVGLHVADGKILYRPRVTAPGSSHWQDSEINLANPNLSKALGDILVSNLPKNSKFYDVKAKPTS